MVNVIEHYDLLIDEGNDPINDSPELAEYMNKFDGDIFVERLLPDKSKSALEIGIGTGRIAAKVAPLFGQFTGIDISPKTAKRASENPLISGHVICGDFLAFDFHEKFDVIYSTLTFMHIKNKRAAITKVFELLNKSGRFVLSIDKNQSKVLDYGNRKIRLYPDDKAQTEKIIKSVGFTLLEIIETDLAYIFVCAR